MKVCLMVRGDHRFIYTSASKFYQNVRGKCRKNCRNWQRKGENEIFKMRWQPGELLNLLGTKLLLRKRKSFENFASHDLLRSLQSNLNLALQKLFWLIPLCAARENVSASRHSTPGHQSFRWKSPTSPWILLKYFSNNDAIFTSFYYTYLECAFVVWYAWVFSRSPHFKCLSGNSRCFAFYF